MCLSHHKADVMRVIDITIHRIVSIQAVLQESSVFAVKFKNPEGNIRFTSVAPAIQQDPRAYTAVSTCTIRSPKRA